MSAHDPLSPAYDRIAHLYDVDMARNMALDDVGFYASWAAPGARVLELGCGNGRILLELAARGCRAFGVDRAPSMLRGLRAKAAARGLSPSVALMDVRRLGFADASFDLVLCPYSLITYMITDTDAMDLLREAARVLHGEGRLVIDAFVPRALTYSRDFQRDYERPCGEGTLTRSKRLRPVGGGVNRIERRYEVRRPDGTLADTIETVEDVRPYAPERLAQLVAGAGFRNPRSCWDYGAAAAAAGAQFLAIAADAPTPQGETTRVSATRARS